MHPFHPLAGQRLRRVAENANVAGRRVVCLDSSGAAWAVPIEWTDLAERTLEWEINAGRRIRLVPSHTPDKPQTSIAWIVYSEQEGVYRQAGGSSGERNAR